MGSRRTDPYCDKLERISGSDVDKGYPPFIRINPIINWTYEQVWKFLLDFSIPYCKLYEIGYTYLGNKDNTERNYHLQEGDNNFKPAWQLEGQYEVVSRKEINPESNQFNAAKITLQNSIGIFICEIDSPEILELSKKYSINTILILSPEKLEKVDAALQELQKINFEK